MTTKTARIKLMNTIICRTPAFSTQQNLTDCWPALKNLIKEASPDFYAVITDWNQDQLMKANEKAVFSVWKYFNRARYRSTPFANFAAISFAKTSGCNDDIHKPLSIQQAMQSHAYTDWSHKDEHLQDTKKIARLSQWFQSNTTYYVVGDRLRYIRHTGEYFELASIACFDELVKLLSQCRSKQSKPDIYEVMETEFNLKQRVVDNMLCQLIECQLLLTELMPNITGEDYFTRLKLPSKPGMPYIIAERSVVNGQSNIRALDAIPEYLDFIKDFLPVSKNAYMDAFIQEFNRKFDQRAIPLSIALDPETGIGYGNMAQEPEESALNDLFDNQVNKNTDLQFTYTTQHRFLLNKLIKGDTIKLETFEDADIKNHQSFPNTLNVMFQYYNNMPVIQTAGGCTANSTLGRFTLASEEAKELARHIAHTEEAANPDVIFFDIAYQPEKRVDNVNRRSNIYRYELPILTWSCNGSALSMDDILVLVRNKQVILWSKQHKKRLILRIASAYNYTRSDLAVYRFLCDVQHQGIASNLTFNFRQLFPGLDHYPRVMYKNVIVSAAMWRFDLRFVQSINSEQDINAIKNWLQHNNINIGFKCGDTDQTLYFDPNSPEDIKAFLIYCRQNTGKELYIQEALIDETSTISDEKGQPYLPQYIANYYHGQTIYDKIANVPDYSSAAASIYLPGDEWLYFEIYCHPQRANDILEHYLNPIINHHKKHLQKWFFIRYTDPKPHIRLRLKMKDDTWAGPIINDIQTALKPLHEQGLIADIQLKTYHQETERYGSQKIDLVEDFFCHDSRYAQRLISRNYSTNQLYKVTLSTMNRLFALAFEDVPTRLELIKTIAGNFGKEFNISSNGFKTINRSYESFRTDKTNYSLPVNDCFIQQYDHAFKTIMNACTTHEKEKMVADLVHMHINRIFYTNQRMHEAILYQYLQKQVKAQQHFSTAAAALLSQA